MSAMLSVAEAQNRLLALAPVLPTEQLSLVEAAYRWTTEDIFALRTQPFADLSAMDGYAIRFAEMPGPWRVAGESKAGSPLPSPLSEGEALRIFTGAPVPPGADTILIQEDARRDGDDVHLAGGGPQRSGRHIRRLGEEFSQGDLLVARGSRLTPARIALAATGGHAVLHITRKVRIVLISTGDELILPGATGEKHHLPGSNGPMLATLLAQPGAEIVDHGIIPDDRDVLARAIHDARTADIIITTGGASVGDHDLVKPAFEAAGANLDFWRVAMRPGKPVMAGTLGETLIIGLPGNPVSAYVTALLFAAPLVSRLAGDPEPCAKLRRVPLAAALPAGGVRAEYLRGIWRDGAVLALANQDSAALTALSDAEVLIARPANAAAADAGTLVEILDIA